MPCQHDQSVSTHGKCNICGAQLHYSETLKNRAIKRGDGALAEIREVLNHEGRSASDSVQRSDHGTESSDTVGDSELSTG